jgi:anti-sigma factor ChrR (cupin superfamily)
MPTGKHASDGELLAWENGSIDGAQRNRLADHLEGCLACRERLIQFQEVDRVLQDQYPLVEDVESQNRIIERMRVELDDRCTGGSEGV